MKKILNHFGPIILEKSEDINSNIDLFFSSIVMDAFSISSGSMAALDNTSFRATEGIKLFKEVIDADRRSILDFKLSNLTRYLKILNNAKSFFVE